MPSATDHPLAHMLYYKVMKLAFNEPPSISHIYANIYASTGKKVKGK